jgi:DNA-binding NarL/FixJ family response regulator
MNGFEFQGTKVFNRYGMEMVNTLLVEDDRTFRQTLKNLLIERFPTMHIEEACNGAEAFERIETAQPEIVFMDIKLPGENGLLLTRRIKQIHPEIVVIILTSYAFPEYRQAALENGANYFTSKHETTHEDLMRLVDSVLPDPSSS